MAGGWIDSHCHLFMTEDPVDEVLERATAAGVERFMCPGVDLETSLQARRVAADHPDRVWWAAGIHPHDADRWDEQQGRIEALIRDADAVGEIGLDYYRDLSPREDQRRAFQAQLDLAAALGKPALIHIRDAFADAYEMVAAAGLGERAVLHCWTGGPRWTKRFDRLGVTFSFAGPVAFPNGDTVRRAAAVAPRDRTMVETDTPYLAPPPHRGEANEPAFVPLVGAAVAGVWGVDPAEVAAASTATATRVYRSGT
ncbi:MAG: TatD family hydrolase [Acidimicrobiia bacterium]|jgi:TatD DNase family protein